MGTTAEKLAYLADTKTAIKDAIISKGTDVPEGTTFRQYADLISGISTGLSDVDLALANATPEDVFSGKTFYSGNKELKTGTALSTPVTATESDVKNGKTYYDNYGVLRTGTESAGLKIVSGRTVGTTTISYSTLNVKYVAARPYIYGLEYTFTSTDGGSYNYRILGYDPESGANFDAGTMEVSKTKTIFKVYGHEMEYMLFCE